MLATIPARRLPLLAMLGMVLVLALSGCTAIKPGSVALTQPVGIGPLSLRLALCTAVVSETATVACGPSPEASEGQMLIALVVPAGTTVPATIVASPGPGATPTTFTSNKGVAQAFIAEASPPGSLPPPGFEVAGYASGVIAEAAGQATEWALAAELAQPPSADGGSSGLPFKATVRSGWRLVSPELPPSRPVKCFSPAEFLGEVPETPGAAFCETGTIPGNEVTLGISDLKLKAPPATAVAPGTKVKLPFLLDFASSATELPKFKLTVSSKLPGAELAVSNNSFSRGPSNPANNRAPATARQVIVEVPASARLGSYSLAFTATAAQGGAVTATTQLLVRPRGKAKVTVPRKVKASVAASRGIPVTLGAPIAGTRFQVLLKAPKRLLKRVRVARESGQIALRLRLGKPKAQAFRAAGTKLRLEAKVNQPGTKKPLRIVRTLRLR